MIAINSKLIPVALYVLNVCRFNKMQLQHKLIPVALYALNVCRFNKMQLQQLDQIVQNELQQNNMMLIQFSEERVYTKRDCNGRVLKSLQQI